MERRIAMVLNDGTTHTGIVGCSVVEIPAEIDPSEEDEFIRDAVQSKSPSVIGTFENTEHSVRYVAWVTIDGVRGIGWAEPLV